MAKQTFTTGQVLTAAQMTSLQQTAMGGGSATAKTASYVLTAADAGTTIIMNSGSATTITVNTALFAAGDTVFILNQGAGVCTITAGTATVTTAASLALGQNETGQLYFVSTSAAIFTEYMQAAGAASGLTLITTASPSAASAVNINNCFTSTYQNYLIYFNYIGSTGTNLSFRLRNGGTDRTTANYDYFGQSILSTGTTGAWYNSGGTKWDLNDSSATRVTGQIQIFNPQETSITSGNVQSVCTAATDRYVTQGINFNSSTTNDGFSLFPDSGTFTGSVRVYGLANS